MLLMGLESKEELHYKWTPHESPKTPQPSVNRGGKTFLPFISHTNGWIEGWKLCDHWPSLSPSALQPPMQKSQQQPLATFAQGQKDKVRGRGEEERARERVYLCLLVGGSVCFVCNGQCVHASVFVLRHKGFKIRYKGAFMWLCFCGYKAQGDM